MIEYIFNYNLPSGNSKWGLSNTMLTVRATLLPNNGISIEFLTIGAGTIVEVISWNKAIEEIRAIARMEFDMKLAVAIVQQKVNEKAA